MNTSGSPVLFDYPSRALVDRIVPKSRIVVAAKPGRRVRDQLTSKVARIVWQYKLAPETVNLKGSNAVPEIQVFRLLLKGFEVKDELPADLLRSIDRAIGFPLIFEMTTSREDGSSTDQVRTVATYKRPNESDAKQWVIGEYFATDWLPADAPRAPLPVALDLPRLYEQILRQLIPVPAREGESMEGQVERHSRISTMQRECRRLEARIQREKQFNRKVEINSRLRYLKNELEALRCSS